MFFPKTIPPCPRRAPGANSHASWPRLQSAGGRWIVRRTHHAPGLPLALLPPAFSPRRTPSLRSAFKLLTATNFALRGGAS